MMKHYLMRHDATVDRKNESEEINLTLQKENSFLSFFFFKKKHSNGMFFSSDLNILFQKCGPCDKIENLT